MEIRREPPLKYPLAAPLVAAFVMVALEAALFLLVLHWWSWRGAAAYAFARIVRILAGAER